MQVTQLIQIVHGMKTPSLHIDTQDKKMLIILLAANYSKDKSYAEDLLRKIRNISLCKELLYTDTLTMSLKIWRENSILK